MATRRDKGRNSVPETKAEEDPAPPPMPPESPEEEMQNREILATLEEMTRELRARNLANAVLLAQQAARGHGPLVAHFGEIGRRFGHLLEAPQQTLLRVVEGGKQ